MWLMVQIVLSFFSFTSKGSSSKGHQLLYYFSVRIDILGLYARKPVLGGLRTTQVQTSLRISAV